MTELLSCETCAYHKRRVRTWGAPKVFTSEWVECRRRPPTIVGTGNDHRSVWPQVELEDFCGEWSAKFK